MSDSRTALEAALAGRYAIERELGRGGMATVYLAQDLRHDRPVALKLLHPELAASLGDDRFQREIKLAARLQHPHILTVYDSGESEGRFWFTMPYVEGESLRDRLHRERQLPVEDAIRIAREAAQALQYAHDHGVVHRDIKPENLMLTRDGHTLVADFGIARALSSGAAESRLTETGLAVGTPAYMSPEQAAGDRGVDARTDVYSLAAVLYEMLAGEPPYTGATTQAILAKRFTEPPPSVRSVRPSVPESVDQAIRKALAPVAADRHAGMPQFSQALAMAERRDGGTADGSGGDTVIRSRAETSALPPFRRSADSLLRRSVLVLVVGILIGLGVLFAWRRGQTGTGPGGERRLAVLPFENLGAPEDGYFADGVTDEIRGKLSALPGLQVTARSSSSQYKDTPKSPAEIGRELGVDYLLTGTVRWVKGGTGSRVRVSPELIQVATGSSRWQEPFDAALTDVFQVQADVAGRVAEALNLALGSGERERLAEKPTQSLTAYDAYLKGEDVSDAMGTTTPATLRQALGHYERAVALDSAFALAWARVSQAHALLYFLTVPTRVEDEAARAAAERALALAPGLPEGHLALGDYHYRVTKEYPRALEQYALGQRIAPRNADLLVGIALTEQTVGRWEAALQHLREAQTLDPRSVNTARRLGLTMLRLRRYPEALQVSDKGLALAPANLELREHKAMVYLAQGDLAAAQAVLRDTPKEIDPPTLVAYIGTFWDLAWVLDDEQQRLLVGLPPGAFDDDRANWGLVLAQAHWYRGDQARARAYADSARIPFEQQLRDTPEDAQLVLLYGLTLAYLGRKTDAIREGERGLALRPVSEDAYSGAYNQHLLARIYILAGEYAKAIDQLESLLGIPYHVSPGWLRIDPTFDPLRKHPRFQKLVEGS